MKKASRMTSPMMVPRLWYLSAGGDGGAVGGASTLIGRYRKVVAVGAARAQVSECRSRLRGGITLPRKTLESRHPLAINR